MTRTIGARIRTPGSFAVAAIVCALLVLWQFSPETRGQNKAKSKTTARTDGSADLAADIDDAISTVEAGDFQRFLERYAPVEVLRKMRQGDLVEQAAAALANRPQGKAQLLAVLSALQKQTPRYDKSRGLATLDFDPFGAGVPEAAGDLHLPPDADPKLTGLGLDLATVVSLAINLLEAGDTARFVERLFPPTEIARLQQAGQLAALLQQFKDSPEIQAAMLADFKRIQGAKPELADNGQTVIFKISAEKDQPERTVKFQKASGDWRLFDDAPRVGAELVRQAKLKPRSGVTSVQMELIGGNWRFVELPMLRAGAN